MTEPLTPDVLAYLDSLPATAAALGRNFGVNVRVGADGAFTDGKTISLPMLPLRTSRERDALLGLLVHESGHVRFTFPEEPKPADVTVAEHNLDNALEDVRIEVAMGREFRGAEMLLREAYRGNVERIARSRKPGHPIRVVGEWLVLYGGIDALHREWMRPAWKRVNKFAIKLFGEDFVAKLTAIAADIKNMKSIKDVHAIRDRVMQLLRDAGKDAPQGQQDPQGDAGTDGSSQGQQQSESPKSSGQPQDGNPQGLPSGEQAEQGNESAEGGDAGNASGESAATNGQANSAAQAAVNADLSVNAKPDPLDLSAELKEEVASKTAEDTKIAFVEQSGYSGFKSGVGDSLKMEVGVLADPAEYKTNAVLGRTRLAQASQFDLAKALRRLSEVKNHSAPMLRSSGSKICGSVLSRTACGNFRVFERSGIAQRDRESAIQILLDLSDSMSGSSEETALQSALALSLGVETARNIKTAMAVFPGRAVSRTCGLVAPIYGFGQNLQSCEGVIGGLGASGGTPIIPALQYAEKSLAARPEKNKVCIVITDGCCDDVTEERQKLAAVGARLIGIGIRNDLSQRGFKNCIEICSVRHLEAALMKLVENFVPMTVF